MLWYLHLCALRKVVVIAYEDFAEGAMEVNSNGSGQFTGVERQPRVTITPESNAELAEQLHGRANAMCFVARSVNFPVSHNPTIRKTSGH